jgi:protein-S-isoprenylcysteine O-methyltransferase Ste14
MGTAKVANIVKTAIFYGAVCTLVLWLIPFGLLNESMPTSLEPVRFAFAAPLMTLGLLITMSCSLEFALRGRGTPLVFDPPRSLVNGALYRRVRNPMYLGWLLLALGEAILLHSWLIAAGALVFWAITHAVVVFYEEPGLQKRFGADYDAYRAAVPRWLPRI